MRSPFVLGSVACSFLLLVACSGAHAGADLFDESLADGGATGSRSSSSSEGTSAEGGSTQGSTSTDGGSKSGSSSTSDPDTNQCDGKLGSSSCNKCIEKSCCDEAVACVSEVQCGALIQCGEACGPNPDCVQRCVATNPSGAAPLQALVSCMSKQCAKKCN